MALFIAEFVYYTVLSGFFGHFNNTEERSIQVLMFFCRVHAVIKISAWFKSHYIVEEIH